MSVSLSCLSLSGFKSHFMGFCSFGTSSSFQICPGTFRAVPGMLRIRSVDYRDCTNERIQAVLVSRAGTGSSPCRCLSLPQCFLLPPPPAPCSPPAPQCPQERSPSDRPPLPSWSWVSRGEGGVHTLCKVGLPSRSPPSFCTAAVFSASLLLGEAFGGS